MKDTNANKLKLFRQGIFLVICIFLYFPKSTGQFNISVQSESFIDYCKGLTYQLELERTVSSVQDEIILEVQFSDPVKYESNSLGLELIDVNPTLFRFELNDILDCAIQKGILNIIPECFDIFTNIEATFKIKSAGSCVADVIQETVVKNPFVDIQFSDYVYQAQDETLTKSLTLFNAGSNNINSFYILPLIDNNFSSLTSTSLGSIKEDTLFIYETDLNGAAFSTGSEMILELIFTLNQCDLRSINYEIGYVCDVSKCQTTQQFVDENDIYQNNVQGALEHKQAGFYNTLNYSICEPSVNNIEFKNLVLEQRTSIGDIFNIAYIIEIEDRYSRRFNECINITASIGNQSLSVVRNSDTQHLLFFDNITSDPDGRGGIDDLDGDGQFDDLPLGDSTIFDLKFQLNDECFENYENLGGVFTLTPTYSNYCQLMSNARTSAESEFAILSDHFNVSFPPIEAFSRDQSNKRFLENAENITTTIRIRPSKNVTTQCNSNEFLLTLDVPTKLQFDNTKDIIYYDNNDTTILVPKIINDTLLEFSFTELDSSQTFIDISFISICDIDTDTNYDSAIAVCDQCVEYNLESLRAELSKPCNLNCAATALSRQGRSAPFYTQCEDFPELEEPFVIEGIDIFNMSPGYIDKERTTKRDPFLNPSSINNRYFFDGDTMLIQVPFSFNCIQELQNYSIIINENQLSLHEFEILESNIIILDSTTNTESGRCSASLFLSQSETQISFSFGQSSFNLPCIDPNQNHILELSIKFNRECKLADQCRLATSGSLQTLTDITLSSGCSKRVFYGRDTVFINEVFKEEFFNPIENLFSLQLEIYESIPMSFTLFPNVFNTKIADTEFKDYPILKEINYTIPEGFELIGNLMLVEADFFFIEVSDFVIGEEAKGDTLLNIPPTIIKNSDGSTEYQFKNLPSDYSNGSILKPVVGGLMLKSVCEPSQHFQEVNVSGVIEYVNYADDSRDLINYPFSKNAMISFLPEEFNAVDDFQILESKSVAEWTYDKNLFSFFNFFNSGSDAFSSEQQYRFEYKSNGMIVDSITTFAMNDGFELMSNDIRIQTNSHFIGDSIIELTLLPQEIVQVNGDTLIRDIDLGFIKIHTSQHACGFDTLLFELGRKAQFLQDSCSNNIFTDFIVSYSPPGFPQLKFSTVPSDIKTFIQNQFEFTLSNIGEGELIENKIHLEGLPEGNYQLAYKDENELTDISEAIEIENDQFTINLNTVNLQRILGLSGLHISTLDFILTASDLCIEDTFLKLSACAESLSFCGDTIKSPLSKTMQLPYIVEDDLLFDINVSSFVNTACLDTANINIIIKSEDSQAIVNPRIELIVPNDIFLFPNSVKLNGQLIADPITKPADDNFSKRFIIQDGIPDVIDSTISIDISFDGECIDLCREDDISAYMLSELETSCASNNISQQLVTRAYRVNEQVNWKADIIFENIESSLVDSKGDDVILEINGRISITNKTRQNEAIILYSFSDENQNEQYDSGELVFDNVIIDADRINSNTAEIKDSIIIPSQYLCSLALTTAIDEDCVCEPTTVSIKQNGDVTFERIIQNCSDNVFPIQFQYIGTCNSDITPNPRVTDNMDGIFSYQPDLGLASDTIHVINECIACLITERVIILNSDPDISIDVKSTSDCNISAEVIYNGSSIIPEQFEISWSSGESTKQIENVSEGELIVRLIDQQSCTYSDTIFIENNNEFDYNIETVSGSCTENIPSSALITVSNNPAATILWDDGSQDLSRTELDPGNYHFTLTNDIGCTQIDSIHINPTGNLDFGISVTHVNCNSPLSGKIEFGAQDTSLQFSLDGISFSKQRLVDSLGIGSFLVFAKNELGCLDSMSVDIILDDALDSGLNTFLIGSLNQELTLNMDPSPQLDLEWNWTSDDFELSCYDCPSPTLIVEKEGTVRVVLTNGFCSTEDIISISISLSDDIYLPNVFYPNSISGNNLFFVYPNSSFDEIDLYVYDRWGNQVFDIRSVDVDNAAESGWDGRFNGKESIEGVYVFKAIVRRFVDDTEIELLGDFILVR